MQQNIEYKSLIYILLLFIGLYIFYDDEKEEEEEIKREEQKS